MAQAVSVLDGDVNRNWDLEDSQGGRHLLTLFHDTVTGARAAMLDYEEVPGSAGTTNLFNLVAGRVNIPFSVTNTEDTGCLSIIRRGLTGFSYECELNGRLVLDTTSIVQNSEDEYEISMPASVDVGTRISGVTWYEMHTTRKADGKGTLVHRRFRDFDALHEQVESLMKGHHLRSSLPRFPGKKSKLWTNHGDLSFVEDRRKALEQYMQILLRLPHVSTLDSTRAFLGMVGNLREFSVVWEGKELGAILKRASDAAGGTASGGSIPGGGGGPPVVASVSKGPGKSPPGVSPGDRLFKVNGESTELMTLEAAFSSVKRASRPVLLHFLGPIFGVDSTVAPLPEAFLRRRLPDKQNGHTPFAADGGPPLAEGLLGGDGGAGAVASNTNATGRWGVGGVSQMRWPAWGKEHNQNEEAAVATAASSAGNGRSEGSDGRTDIKVPKGRPMRPFGDGSNAAGILPASSGLFGGNGSNERPGEARSANAWRSAGGELNRPARPSGDRYGSGGAKGGPPGWMPDMTIGAGASSSSSSGATRWAMSAPPAESTRSHTSNATGFPGGSPVQQRDRKDESGAFPTGGTGLRSGASTWPERPSVTATGGSFSGATGHVHTDKGDGGRGGRAGTTDGLITGRRGEQRQGVFGASSFSGLDGSTVPRAERSPVATPFGVADTRVEGGDEDDEEENPFA